MPQSPDDLDLEREALKALNSPAKRVGKFFGVLLLLALFGGAAYWAYNTWSVAQEDEVQPVYPASKTTLAGVNLTTIHTDLFPQVCFAHQDAEARKQAFASLLGALQAEPKLYEIATGLRDAWKLSTMERIDAEDTLIEAWNVHIQENGVPLAIKPPISRARRAKSSFCVLAYAVVTDITLNPPDEDPIPVQVGSREDSINLVEGYLGWASTRTGRAFITIDTTADAAADKVWPMLTETPGEDLTSLQKDYLSPVQSELQALLPQEHLQPLQELAWARQTLVSIRATLNTRRRTCNTSLGLSPVFLPVRGLSSDTIDQLRNFAQGEGASCPPITYNEVDRLRKASWDLARAAGIRNGVRALTSVVARNVVVHEARHVLDNIHPLTCTTCPTSLNGPALREFSSYLATLAWGVAPYTEAFMICSSLSSRGGTRQHRRAKNFLVQRLLPKGCDAPPPTDLQQRARALETELFGRSTPLEVPASFPQILISKYY